METGGFKSAFDELEAGVEGTSINICLFYLDLPRKAGFSSVYLSDQTRGALPFYLFALLNLTSADR